MTDEEATLDEPWSRTLPARIARDAAICGVFGSIIDSYAHHRIAGREHLTGLLPPVIFVANHASHVDTPALLRSLPGAWRRRTAVAAAADYFYADRLLAIAVSLTFGTVPLERRGVPAMTLIEELIASRWNLVIYAEGTRSRDGRVGVLRPGAAALAARHELPIVPVHIGGTHAAMPIGSRWMVRPAGGGRWARHPLTVSFGPAIEVRRRDDRFETIERVRSFMTACGAETTPDPKMLARRAARQRTPAGARA
jgi:1-acyl-sn-glycerol-3-phosphate acyltransferase